MAVISFGCDFVSQVTDTDRQKNNKDIKKKEEKRLCLLYFHPVFANYLLPRR
jgi:hypothetical protein